MESARHRLKKAVAVSLAAAILAGCSVWPVEKRLLSKNRYIRTTALKKLRYMKDDRRAQVIEAMVKALSTDDNRIANRAAETLVAAGPPALDPVIHAAGSQDPFVRSMAVSIIGGIGSPPQKVMPELVSALEDRHPLVREEAAHALGRLGMSAVGAVPALYMTLTDADPGVREAAQTALKRMGVKDPAIPKNQGQTGLFPAEHSNFAS